MNEMSSRHAAYSVETCAGVTIPVILPTLVLGKATTGDHADHDQTEPSRSLAELPPVQMRPPGRWPEHGPRDE
jgi:hypothetical protein